MFIILLPTNTGVMASTSLDKPKEVLNKLFFELP